MVEVDLRGWLPLMGVVLGEGLIAEILGQAEVALLPFVTDDGGSVAFASPAILATVVKPPIQDQQMGSVVAARPARAADGPGERGNSQAASKPMPVGGSHAALSHAVQLHAGRVVPAHQEARGSP
jgi:hypothetical protein